MEGFKLNQTGVDVQNALNLLTANPYKSIEDDSKYVLATDGSGKVKFVENTSLGGSTIVVNSEEEFNEYITEENLGKMISYKGDLYMISEEIEKIEHQNELIDEQDIITKLYFKTDITPELKPIIDDAAKEDTTIEDLGEGMLSLLTLSRENESGDPREINIIVVDGGTKMPGLWYIGHTASKSEPYLYLSQPISGEHESFAAGWQFEPGTEAVFDLEEAFEFKYPASFGDITVTQVDGQDVWKAYISKEPFTYEEITHIVARLVSVKIAEGSEDILKLTNDGLAFDESGLPAEEVDSVGSIEIDKTPIKDSENLVTSGGVYEAVDKNGAFVAHTQQEFNALLGSENIGKLISYNGKLHMICAPQRNELIQVNDVISKLYFDSTKIPDYQTALADETILKVKDINPEITGDRSEMLVAMSFTLSDGSTNMVVYYDLSDERPGLWALGLLDPDFVFYISDNYDSFRKGWNCSKYTFNGNATINQIGGQDTWCSYMSKEPFMCNVEKGEASIEQCSSAIHVNDEVTKLYFDTTKVLDYKDIITALAEDGGGNFLYLQLADNNWGSRSKYISFFDVTSYVPGLWGICSESSNEMYYISMDYQMDGISFKAGWQTSEVDFKGVATVENIRCQDAWGTWISKIPFTTTKPVTTASSSGNMLIAQSEAEFNELLIEDNIGKAISYNNELYLIEQTPESENAPMHVGERITQLCFDTTKIPDIETIYADSSMIAGDSISEEYLGWVFALIGRKAEYTEADGPYFRLGFYKEGDKWGIVEPEHGIRFYANQAVADSTPDTDPGWQTTVTPIFDLTTIAGEEGVTIERIGGQNIWGSYISKEPFIHSSITAKLISESTNYNFSNGLEQIDNNVSIKTNSEYLTTSAEGLSVNAQGIADLANIKLNNNPQVANTTTFYAPTETRAANASNSCYVLVPGKDTAAPIWNKLGIEQTTSGYNFKLGTLKFGDIQVPQAPEPEHFRVQTRDEFNALLISENIGKTVSYSEEGGLYQIIRDSSAASSVSAKLISLPATSRTDIGKFLRVGTDGEWVAETIPNAEGLSL